MLKNRLFLLLSAQLFSICIPAILYNSAVNDLLKLDQSSINYLAGFFVLCFCLVYFVNGYAQIASELNKIRTANIITALTFPGLIAVVLFAYFINPTWFNNLFVTFFAAFAITFSAYAAILELCALTYEQKEPVLLLVLLIPIAVQTVCIFYLTTQSQAYGYPFLTNLLAR